MPTRLDGALSNVSRIAGAGPHTVVRAWRADDLRHRRKHGLTKDSVWCRTLSAVSLTPDSRLTSPDDNARTDLASALRCGLYVRQSLGHGLHKGRVTVVRLASLDPTVTAAP